MATNGWNRNTEGNSPKAPVKSRGSAGWILGAAAVVLSAVAAWILWPSDGEAVRAPKAEKVSRIREVTPAPAPVAQTNVVAKPRKPMYWEVDASQTNGFTAIMQKKWVDMHTPRTKPAHVERKRAKFAIFNHYSENLIASVLCAEPGQSMIGTPNYKHVNEDFLKSCEEPIIVTKDDDEYTANLKRQMNETKIELKARVDAGEDLGQIIEESRKELRQLAQYKMMLQRELKDQISQMAESSDDVDSYIEAANVMLEKKGVAPIKLGPLTKKRFVHLIKTKETRK